MKRSILTSLIFVLIFSSVCLAAASDVKLDASISIKSQKFIYDSEFSVSVYIDAVDLRGGSAKLVYDETKITAISAAFTESPGIKIYNSTDDGVISFVFYTESAYTGNFKIADIDFKIKEGNIDDIISVGIEAPTVSDGKNEIPAKQTGLDAVLMINVSESGSDEVSSTEESGVTSEETSDDTATEAVSESDVPVIVPVTSEDETSSIRPDDTDTFYESGTGASSESGGSTSNSEITTSDRTSAESEKEPAADTDSDGTDTSEVSGRGKGIRIVTALVIAAAAAGAATGAVFIVKNIKSRKNKS